LDTPIEIRATLLGSSRRIGTIRAYVLDPAVVLARVVAICWIKPSYWLDPCQLCVSSRRLWIHRNVCQPLPIHRNVGQSLRKPLVGLAESRVTGVVTNTPPDSLPTYVVYQTLWFASVVFRIHTGFSDNVPYRFQTLSRIRKDHQTFSRHFPDTFQTLSRHPPDTFQTPSRHLFRHLSDTFQTPS
jgi:hypothetical protein